MQEGLGVLGAKGCRGERQGEDVVVFTVEVRSLKSRMVFWLASKGGLRV